MLLSEIQPFVRYAAKTTYFLDKQKTRAYDCRLFYILSGSGIITIEGDVYCISKGDLFICQPGTEYCIERTKENSLQLLVLNFDFSYNNAIATTVMMPSIVSEFDESKILVKVHFEDNNIFNHPVFLSNMFSLEGQLSEIVFEYSGNKAYNKEISSGILRIVLFSILRAASAKNNLAIDNTSLIIEYIRNNYYKEINNAEISKVFNYHPNYLSRQIKKRTGQSLHEYLLLYRINISLDLLSLSNLTISEIALQTGFKSLSHFSSCFNKNIGMRPIEYRKRFIDRLI